MVYAYGFDKIGYGGMAEGEDDGFNLRFISYRSTDSFESAEGIVIPSGIFEDFETRGAAWQAYTICNPDKHRLADREKQMLNAYNAGAWVCFLLGRLDNGSRGEWADTDLAKKLANQMFQGVHGHDPQPHVESKADEFREFFKTYGIARTSLGSPRYDAKTRILATSSGGKVVYAAELGGSFFFLPYKSLNDIGAELTPLLSSVIRGIVAYKQRNDLYLPDWVESIEFQAEKRLAQAISEGEARLGALKQEAMVWRNYKAILTASGRVLNTAIVNVLRTFFGLNLHSQEEYIEDAIIYGPSNEPAFVVEIKGVNGGIKRDNINQLDSHRERLGISHEIPGLLIINDFADVDGLEERRAKPIDLNHLELAMRQNVRILRTTALLDLMFAAEQGNDRASMFMSACLAGNPVVLAPPA